MSALACRPWPGSTAASRSDTAPIAIAVAMVTICAMRTQRWRRVSSVARMISSPANEADDTAARICSPRLTLTVRLPTVAWPPKAASAPSSASSARSMSQL